jgi:carbon-monoxide dehydrogenase large subunit
MPNITASCTRRELGRPVKWTDEETAPAETGIDRIELRRRKHWRLPVGTALPPQGGEPCACRLCGRGIRDYLELTGPPGREMGGIRFAPDDTITIITGTLDYGQGHASPSAQVLSTRLGVSHSARSACCKGR